MYNGNKELYWSLIRTIRKKHNSAWLVDNCLWNSPLPIPYVTTRQYQERLCENGGLLLKQTTALRPLSRRSSCGSNFAYSCYDFYIKVIVVLLFINTITLKIRVSFSFKWKAGACTNCCFSSCHIDDKSCFLISESMEGINVEWSSRNGCMWTYVWFGFLPNRAEGTVYPDEFYVDQTRATLLHLETLGVPTACEDRSVKETEISRSLLGGHLFWFNQIYKL